MLPLLSSLFLVGVLVNALAYAVLYRREQPSREVCPRTPSQVGSFLVFFLGAPVLWGRIHEGDWLLALGTTWSWMLGAFVASLFLVLRVRTWRQHHEERLRLKALMDERRRSRTAHLGV